MNPNTPPQKTIEAVKDLAKQVFPIFKDFIKERRDAQRDRQAQQQGQPQYYQAQKQPLIAKIEGAVNRFLHQPNHRENRPPDQPMQVYQQPYGQMQQQAYGQTHQRRRSGERYQNTAPQGREVEIRECLRAHNEARRSAPGRSRPDLRWDERLATHAQRWAEHLIRRGILEHDYSGTGEGENLYMVSGSGAGRATFKDAVDAWNREILHYRGQKIGMADLWKYGHYTQNVWPSTTRVGMARVEGRGGLQIIVARYSPPGNVIGRTAYE